MNERWILHPVTVGSLAVLLANDHILKWRWPGLITGKLSDFAGLIAFPLILAGVLGATRVRAVARCALVTAAVFAAIKLVPAATDAWCDAIATGQWLLRAPLALLSGAAPRWTPVDAVTDPTDLVALPMTLVSVLISSESATRPWPWRDLQGSAQQRKPVE